MKLIQAIRRAVLRATHFIWLIGACSVSHAAVIEFSGQLDIVFEDAGGAVYSGVPIGTPFTGAIDDVSASGFISDGVSLTSFGCCIAAGGLSVDNDLSLIHI